MLGVMVKELSCASTAYAVCLCTVGLLVAVSCGCCVALEEAAGKSSSSFATQPYVDWIGKMSG